MNNAPPPVSPAFQRLYTYFQPRIKAYQREIDRILENSQKQGHTSWTDSLAYARAVVLGAIFRQEVHIAAITIVALVVGSGIFIPLGSTDMLTRLSLISVAMIVGTSLSFVLLYIILPLHLRFRLSLWWIAAAHALASAVMFCLIEPEIIRNFQAYTVPEFGELFIPILMLYGLTNLFTLSQFKNEICMRHFARTHKIAPIETLLPAQKRGEIWVMSAADHYVELTTAQGTHMRRMTMKAAVDKVGKQAGMRVHRSHWVAYSAMLSMEKDGERFFLTLRNGMRVPVSPKKAAKVACFLDENCLQAAE